MDAPIWGEYIRKVRKIWGLATAYPHLLTVEGELWREMADLAWTVKLLPVLSTCHSHRKFSQLLNIR